MSSNLSGQPTQGDSITVGAANAKRTHARSEQLRWARFQKKYGPNLKAKFGSNGTLVRIEGKPLGKRAGKQAESPSVQELLRDLKPLLSHSEIELSAPRTRSTPVSTRVTFRQLLEGLPVEPGAGLTIGLGPSGELVSLDAQVLPDLVLTNEKRLSRDDARNSLSLPRLQGGRLVAWIQRGKKLTARRAYEFTAEGQQLVVDAQTGRVIFRRDRRLF